MNPELIPESFHLKYNPPKIGISYHLSTNPKNILMHEITVFLKNNATPKGIADELYNHEIFYFKNVDRDQTMNIVKRLINESKFHNSKKEVKDNKYEISTTASEITKPQSIYSNENLSISLKSNQNQKKDDPITSDNNKGPSSSNFQKKEKRSLRDRLGLNTQLKEDEKIESQNLNNQNDAKMNKFEKEDKSIKIKKEEKKLKSNVEEIGKGQKSKKLSFEKRKEAVDFNEAHIYDPEDINSSIHDSEKNDGQFVQEQISKQNNAGQGNLPPNENSENDNLENVNIANEYDGYPPLQKIFFEDLGQELLIDPEGNLYDFEGQFVGTLGIYNLGVDEEEEEYEEDEEMEPELPPPKAMQINQGNPGNKSKQSKLKTEVNMKPKGNKKMNNQITEQLQNDELDF